MIRSPSFSAWNNYKSFNSEIPGGAHSSKDKSIHIANLKGTPFKGDDVASQMSWDIASQCQRHYLWKCFCTLLCKAKHYWCAVVKTKHYRWNHKVTFGNLLSSSMREMMFMGLSAMISRAWWLSGNSMLFQAMCSARYSSCSSLKTWCTKNCWRCSLTMLMQSCSKLWKDKVGNHGHPWTSASAALLLLRGICLNTY